MLIPVVCFSCGQCIAHLYEKYLDFVNNAKNEEDTTPEEAALNALNIKRMCCRRMFLTQCDTYKLMNLS